MATPRKLLLLGICSANPDLLLEEAGRGRLPALGGLLSAGLSGRTHSTPGLFVGATWPSFQTGVNPGRHGCHYSWRVAPRSYEFRRCSRTEQIRHEPFWLPLARAGRKTILLDLPHAKPLPQENLTTLSEWGSHGYDEGGFRSWPENLAAEVERRRGAAPARRSCDDFRKPGELAAYRDALVENAARRAELTIDFLGRSDWDLLAQNFSEGHCAGHQFWHLHDRGHPRHGLWSSLRAGDALMDVYGAIDRAIGEILARAPDQATVMVVVSHGMGPNYSGKFLLDRILERLGVAKLAPRSAPAGSGPPQGPDCPYSKIVPPESLVFRLDNNGPHTGLRVNLAGREPEGKVAPSGFDAFCATLERDLLDLVNAETGRPLLRSVTRADRLYHGEYLAELPELLLEWSNEAPVRRIRSARVGELSGEMQSSRSGHHTGDGLFVARGPGVPAGWVERGVSIMDFAPTIGEQLGVALPGLDGRAIEEFR